MTNWLIKAFGFSAILLAATAWAKETEKTNLYDKSHVGPLADGRVIVPTNQILSPAGRQVMVEGRPTDVALSPNGKWLAVLNISDVQIIDLRSSKIISSEKIKGGSYKGIVFAPD